MVHLRLLRRGPVTLSIQVPQRRYVAWSYWLAVALVGIFGTMAADVLHVSRGVHYLS